MKKKSASSTSSPGSAASGSDSKGLMINRVGNKFRVHRNDKKKSEVQGMSFFEPEGIMDVVDNHPKLVLDVSSPTTSTGGPPQSTITDSKKKDRPLTLDRFKLLKSRPTTFSAADFLARASLLLERGRGLRTLEGRSFTRFAESLSFTDLNYFSLRTSKDSSTTLEGGRLERFFSPLTNWGMMRNGRCLTARTSASRRTGKGSSLSDILEESPSEKYFLSERSVKNLIAHSENHAKKGNGFRLSILTTGREGERGL